MPEPKPLDTFEALAEAAAQASEAWAHRQAAGIAWDIAQEALEAALGEVEVILHPPVALAAAFVATAAPDETEPDHEAAKANIVRSLREAAVVAEHVDVERIAEAAPAGGGPAKRPYTRPRVADLPLTAHQERVLAAVVRARGNRKAVAAEFGFKAYQSVDQTLEVAGKKGRLPIELIPLLPARFAKYSGV